MRYPTVLDIALVASQMREDEIDQYLSFSGVKEYDPDEFVKMVIAGLGADSFVLYGDDELPYCIGGYVEVRPYVWQTWMMGTQDGWDKHWRTITKESRRTMDELLKSGRAHRIQCYSLSARISAHNWYKRGLGMKFECVAQKLFADGRDACCHIKVRE